MQLTIVNFNGFHLKKNIVQQFIFFIFNILPTSSLEAHELQRPLFVVAVLPPNRFAFLRNNAGIAICHNFQKVIETSKTSVKCFSSIFIEKTMTQNTSNSQRKCSGTSFLTSKCETTSKKTKKPFFWKNSKFFEFL